MPAAVHKLQKKCVRVLFWRMDALAAQAMHLVSTAHLSFLATVAGAAAGVGPRLAANAHRSHALLAAVGAPPPPVAPGGGGSQAGAGRGAAAAAAAAAAGSSSSRVAALDLSTSRKLTAGVSQAQRSGGKVRNPSRPLCRFHSLCAGCRTGRSRSGNLFVFCAR